MLLYLLIEGYLYHEYRLGHKLDLQHAYILLLFCKLKPILLYLIFSLLSLTYEKFLINFSLFLHESLAYILYYNTYTRHKRIEIAIPYINKV
ncbi:hypothetical protein BTH38_08465 [Bacillus toyonensis]|nr:hypothetical protein BTH38_08465 [Bacillus toyonensis]